MVPVLGELAFQARRLALNTQYKMKITPGVGTGLMPEVGGLSRVRHWATLAKVHRGHQEACLKCMFPDHTAGFHWKSREKPGSPQLVLG